LTVLERTDKLGARATHNRPAETIVDSKTEQLYRDLEDAEEHLGEVEAQHGSECSLYGDSWPGALHDIDRAFRYVIALRKQLGLPRKRSYKRSACGRYVWPVWVHEDDAAAEPAEPAEHDDIPF
jgi:hypothetical protein